MSNHDNYNTQMTFLPETEDKKNAKR
ncbi:hypothetical protein JOD45_000407, partial [Scopulibacillus daqui]|nr:hypothetical protein [Scopulibacillus daqui]